MSFKEKVFQVVRKIKRGYFLSYKEVAKRAGNEKAYRAVANILKNSPRDVPCHRVIRNETKKLIGLLLIFLKIVREMFLVIESLEMIIWLEVIWEGKI